MTTLKSFKELAPLKEKISANSSQAIPRSVDTRDGGASSPEDVAQPLRHERDGDSVRTEPRQDHGFSISEWASGHARESEKPTPRRARRLSGGGEVDPDERRKRGRVARGDSEPDGSDPGKSVTQRVWEYLRANMSTFTDFTFKDVVPHIGEDTLKTRNGVSAALSQLHMRSGNLEVVNKQGLTYIYRLVSLDPPKFGPSKSHTEKGPRHYHGKRHVLKAADFPPPITTGRISSGVPDMQQIERPRKLPPETVLPPMDFTKIEQRIAAHCALEEVSQLAETAPAAIRRLVAAMEAVKIEILAGYTDEDLLNELKRRRS